VIAAAMAIPVCGADALMMRSGMRFHSSAEGTGFSS
jgi:hypothetical protein